MHDTHNHQKNTGFDDIVAVAVLLTMIIGVIYLSVGAFTAPDTYEWEPLDTDASCYLHTTQVRNWWLTPGETLPEARDIYCLQEAA